MGGEIPWDLLFLEGEKSNPEEHPRSNSVECFDWTDDSV